MTEFPPLVEALLCPRAYPEKPDKVELVQTQISFVFLAGDYVYKMKKPVDFGFLDFTTLEKRAYYCQQEVLLNRRLCPDVYLDVVTVTKSNGEYSVESDGEIVEYAVKMRRLPQDRTMDKLLEAGEVTPEMVAGVAKKLVEFHRQAQTIKDGFGDMESARINAEENFTQTEQFLGVTISPEEYERIKKFTYSFMDRNTQLFDKRVKEGRVKDCHGDLHAAHICFSDEVYIFDCIEFNDRFRYADVASEIAFLAMDLDFHRHGDLSRHFIQIVSRSAGIPELSTRG